jgi:hypothetical protein
LPPSSNTAQHAKGVLSARKAPFVFPFVQANPTRKIKQKFYKLPLLFASLFGIIYKDKRKTDMKISFKKQPKETGLAAVAHPNSETVIKVDGKRVGEISPPSAHTQDWKWRVRIVVKTDEEMHRNAGWKWLTFKVRFESEEEGREWFKTHAEKIASQYELHKFED